MKTKSELREIFDHFDADHNNHIDRREFFQLIQQGLNAEMSQEEITLGFSLIDTDRNGTIEFDEFVRWWKDR